MLRHKKNEDMNEYVFIKSSVDAGVETRVRTPPRCENVDDVGIARGREGRTQARRRSWKQSSISKVWYFLWQGRLSPVKMDLFRQVDDITKMALKNAKEVERLHSSPET